MPIYTLEYADGTTSDFVADDDTSAETIACSRIGDDSMASDQWCDDGTNDDGENMSCLLIWNNEEDREGDKNNSKSAAKLTRIGGVFL